MVISSNPLMTLLNNPTTVEHSTLSELATYLSSNREYKYTQTYIGDSEAEFIRFKVNLVEINKRVLDIFSKFQTRINELSLPLSYRYEMQINKVVTVSSKNPDQLQILEPNEQLLLSFLNQDDFFKHYLCLKFSYTTNSLLFELPNNGVSYNIEHTFEIKHEADIEPAIRYFTNLLKLELCKE